VVEPAAPAVPAADQSTAAPAPSEQAASEQPAPNTTASDDAAFMDAWIRDKAFGSPDRPTLNFDGVVPTAELESAPAGESAPSGDVSPDGVPTEAAGEAGSQPPGRRAAKAAQAAATIESLQAELNTLRSSIPEQVAEATRLADEAKAEAAALRQQTEQADQSAYALVGDPQEYARLLEIPDDQISNEDYQKRETWKANRLVYRPVTERLRAEEVNKAQSWVATTSRTWASQALAVADEIGVDRAELAKPENHDVGRLMKIAATVTEARVKAEYTERLSQAERDRDNARSEALSGRRAPITNGAASGGAMAIDDDDTWLRRAAGFA
jgi:hypothetical protein